MSHTKHITCESEIKVTGFCTHCPSEYVLSIMLEIKSDHDPDWRYMPIEITDRDDDVMTAYDPVTHATEIGITSLPIMFADDAMYRCSGLILSDDTPKDFKFYLESCRIHAYDCFVGEDINAEINIDPKGINAEHMATTDQLPWKYDRTASELLEDMIK